VESWTWTRQKCPK